MFSVHRNNEDLVDAYVEYFIVNKDGSLNSFGEYAFISEIWIHPKLQRKGILQNFIKQEHKKFPVKWIYFKRRKYGDRMRIYPVDWLYKKGRHSGK